MSLRVTVLNNKGGVGKTFVVLALAEAAARRGRRVLVVDMDPQANATRRLRVTPNAGWTLTACLRPGVAKGGAKDYIAPCGWPSDNFRGHIDVLPSDLDLEDRVLEAGVPAAGFRLQRALFGADDSYDLTIVDCPPSIKGHLTEMAISALNGPRDVVLVPLEPEYDAVRSARRTVEYVRMYGEDLGVPHAEVAGVVVNKVRAGVSLHGTREAQLVEAGLPGTVAKVPLRARLAEVQDAALPLSSDPTLGEIVDDFENLAEALIIRGEA